MSDTPSQFNSRVNATFGVQLENRLRRHDEYHFFQFESGGYQWSASHPRGPIAIIDRNLHTRKRRSTSARPDRQALRAMIPRIRHVSGLGLIACTRRFSMPVSVMYFLRQSRWSQSAVAGIVSITQLPSQPDGPCGQMRRSISGGVGGPD